MAFDDPNGTCAWLADDAGHISVKFSTRQSGAVVVIDPAGT
jgi:hypothetical protein